jgi:hypothetical protein
MIKDSRGATPNFVIEPCGTGWQVRHQPTGATYGVSDPEDHTELRNAIRKIRLLVASVGPVAGKAH